MPVVQQAHGHERQVYQTVIQTCNAAMSYITDNGYLMTNLSSSLLAVKISKVPASDVLFHLLHL
jgi:hypothetical protein